MNVAILTRSIERIEFRGHPNVLGLHRNTIEVTKDIEISKRADCVIGVRASKACIDFNSSLKQHIRTGGHLRFELRVKEEKYEFQGMGSNSLKLSDERELVLRKSDFASIRTGAIRCSAAAVDVPRSIIRNLQDPDSTGMLIIIPIATSNQEENFVWNLPG